MVDGEMVWEAVPDVQFNAARASSRYRRQSYMHDNAPVLRGWAVLWHWDAADHKHWPSGNVASISLLSRDLEYFFYILIWAAVHYDLENKTRRPTSKLLVLRGDQDQTLTSELSMVGPGRAGNACKEATLILAGKEFQEIHL